MKKYLLVLIAAFSIKASAQSSLSLTNMNASLSIAPNGTVFMTTKTFSTTDLTVDFRNNGATKNAYKVRRYDILLNKTGTADSAIAHFCFAGSCFGSSPSISPDADTLTPGKSASQLVGANMVLDADLDEGGFVGLSIVKYTLFNTVVSSDTIQFTIKYNAPATVTTGISEANLSLSSFDIFPNPVKDNAVLKVSSIHAFETSLLVYNALGAVVYEKEISLNEGKNKIELNFENLNSGIYFATLKSESGSITKKIIVQ